MPKTDVAELESRLRKMSAIFVEAGDRRGIFTSIYQVGSSSGLKAVESGGFNNEQATRKLIIEFGKTYLDALHRHLTEGRSRDHRKWGRYFELAAQCDVHPLIVMGTGMNTHMVLDLTDAIVRSDLSPEFWDDYMKLGDGLVAVIPDVAQAMEDDWGIPYDQTHDFVHAWWMGKGFNWTVEAASMAWNSVSRGASRAWNWFTGLVGIADENDEEFVDEAKEVSSNPAGSFNIHGLRVFAWAQAWAQSPTLQDEETGAAGRTVPEETFLMSRMWDAVQFMFEHVLAFPIDE